MRCGWVSVRYQFQYLPLPMHSLPGSSFDASPYKTLFVHRTRPQRYRTLDEIPREIKLFSHVFRERHTGRKEDKATEPQAAFT